MNDISISYTINPPSERLVNYKIDDYQLMLEDMGVTEEYLRDLSEKEDDYKEIELNLVEIKDSVIEGKGMFTKEPIKKGSKVGIANIDKKRTQLGRYTNHSGTPNTEAKVNIDKLVFISKKNIDIDQEITVDYRDVRKQTLRLQSRLYITELHNIIEDREDHLTEEDFPLKHYFSEGVYVREFFMEKDAVVIGKIHRHDHIAMLIQGSATVLSEEGNIEMKAPHIWNSKAGEKRAVKANEDCIFVTIHPTDETDLDKIEEQVIAPNYEALEGEL